MRRLKILLCGLTAAALLAPAAAGAGNPKKIAEAFRENYPPAEWHKGLESAYDQVDPSKLRGFVVIQKGGIPAERARFFISWDDYDYRGANVHLGDGDRVTTRRGSPYTYLQRGDVMAVAELKEFGRTYYLKLITPDVYIPMERMLDKRHSRITVMLGFELPKEIEKADDAEKAMELVSAWAKPFSTLEEAQRYAQGLQPGGAAGQASAAAEKAQAKARKQQDRQQEKAELKAAVEKQLPNKVEVEAEVEAVSAGAGDAQRVQSLEEKIEAARREIDDAQRELDQVKQEQSKAKGGR